MLDDVSIGFSEMWKMFGLDDFCIYIYAFGRCFYPKWLELHSRTSLCIPWESHLGIARALLYCLSHMNTS